MRAALDQGRIRPIALTERVIAEIDRLDRRLGAFTVVTRQRAMKEAAEAEAALAAGDKGRPLLGIPYAVKDLFDVAGEATTAGTRLQTDNLAREDCGLVHKLAKAGMILVGKTQTTQLASNVIGYNPDFGTPHNPWQANPWIPGGSSGGAAVAVAAGLVPVSLGTDTGGSVRIPAALCGIVGLKTTYGRVSRAGVYPLCPSLDTVGPLTRSVRDAAEILAAIEGGDPHDSDTLGRRYRDPTIDLASAVTGLRVAFDEAFFLRDAEPEVEKAFEQALRDLETLAVEVVPVSLSTLREAAGLDWWHYFAAEAYASNRHLFEGDADALDPGVHWMREGAALDPQEVSRALRQ
ncbi:MAG TPA: amidase, partial [Kiloniellaceae bacterium]|nr:amidase [Kiloniellaceae bacterium]